MLEKVASYTTQITIGACINGDILYPLENRIGNSQSRGWSEIKDLKCW